MGPGRPFQFLWRPDPSQPSVGHSSAMLRQQAKNMVGEREPELLVTKGSVPAHEQRSQIHERCNNDQHDHHRHQRNRSWFLGFRAMTGWGGGYDWMATLQAPAG